MDLVPQSCWFTNVRSGVAAADWDRVRRMVYRRAGDRCEACGRARDQAAGVRMEAHERWYFDDARGIQVLRRLICLCGSCHGTTHFGLANVQGRAAEALGHLIAVTGTSRELAEAHVDEAFALWQQRSARTWDLDLSILTAAGVTLARPVSPVRRAEVARERLAAEHGDDDELGRWIANDARLQRMSASEAEAAKEPPACGLELDDDDYADDVPCPPDDNCRVTITPGWDVGRYFR